MNKPKITLTELLFLSCFMLGSCSQDVLTSMYSTPQTYHPYYNRPPTCRLFERNNFEKSYYPCSCKKCFQDSLFNQYFNSNISAKGDYSRIAFCPISNNSNIQLYSFYSYDYSPQKRHGCLGSPDIRLGYILNDSNSSKVYLDTISAVYVTETLKSSGISSYKSKRAAHKIRKLNIRFEKYAADSNSRKFSF